MELTGCLAEGKAWLCILTPPVRHSIEPAPAESWSPWKSSVTPIVTGNC
jgi:hypothetical protein